MGIELPLTGEQVEKTTQEIKRELRTFVEETKRELKRVKEGRKKPANPPPQ